MAYLNQQRHEQAKKDLEEALELAESSDIEKKEEIDLIRSNLDSVILKLEQMERQQSEETESKRTFKDALEKLEDIVDEGQTITHGEGKEVVDEVATELNHHEDPHQFEQSEEFLKQTMSPGSQNKIIRVTQEDLTEINLAQGQQEAARATPGHSKARSFFKPPGANPLDQAPPGLAVVTRVSANFQTGKVASPTKIFEKFDE